MTQTAQKPRRRVIRPAGIRVVNLPLSVEAVALLHRYAPSSKSHGLFLAKLLSAHRARQEERQRRLTDTSRVRSCRMRGGGTRGTDTPEVVQAPALPLACLVRPGAPGGCVSSETRETHVPVRPEGGIPHAVS